MNDFINFVAGSGWSREPLHEPAAGTRPLRVVVDETTITTDDADSIFLRSLIRHELVQGLSYADDGPPDDVRQVALHSGGAPEGWIQVVDHQIPPEDHHWVTHSVRFTPDGTTVVDAGIVGNGVLAAEHQYDDVSYPGMSAPDAAAQRRRDAVAMGAANAAQADILVTQREYLIHGRWKPFQDGTVTTDVTGALALIGQFLRSRGIYLGDVHPGLQISVGRDGFYLVAARSLLPAGWPWFAACLRADGDRPQNVTALGQSVFQRIARVLQRRDDLWWALSVKVTEHTAEDAATAFDYALLDLLGAFDASARVAHHLLSLDAHPRSAAWRGRDDWKRTLKRAAPGVAALVATGTPAADVIDLIGLLRNSVHGAALQPMKITRSGSTPDQATVLLPADDAERIQAILRRRQWTLSVGLSEVIPGRPHLAPDRLLHNILQLAIPTLDALLRATNDAQDSPATYDPPTDQLFAPEIRRNVLTQLGLTNLGDQPSAHTTATGA